MKRLLAILMCLALFGVTSQTQADGHWRGRGYWGGYGPYYGYGYGPGPYYGYGYGPYGYNKGAAIAGTVLGALGI